MNQKILLSSQGCAERRQKYYYLKIRIFQYLGGVLEKAFEDIQAKCDIIKKNYDQHVDFYTGMIPFIKLEKDMDIAKLNGENGSFLKNTGMEKYSSYESTARTVLRLMWFLDFVSAMFQGLIKDKSQSLGSVCKDAYNVALASNHPTHLVLAVKAGLLFAPSRESLFEILFQDKKYAQSYQQIEIAQNQIDLIRQRLWTFYKSENLTTLT